MTRTRGALLGAAIALASLLQSVGFFLHPVVPDTAAELVDVVADDPSLWFGIHLTAAAAAALSVLVAPALASLVRGRGARLATLGAAMAVVGGGALAIAFGAEAQLMSVAVDPSVGRDAAVAIAELEGSSGATTLLMAGFPLAGLGGLLVMAGLLRSRAVPRWMPALVLAGTVLSFGAAPGAWFGPLLLAPAVVGNLALGAHVARTWGRSEQTGTTDRPVASTAQAAVPQPVAAG